VISLDTAGRQAAAANWPLSSEIALLGVHGLLHLLGYDDEDLCGAQKMETLTRDLLTKTGIVLPGDHHPFFRSFLED
jgi:probable rRNA maturation factor